eukprot:Skav227756  [mRNA]  locus=scaffold1653:32263:33969:- [translate_table: standard]
MAAIVSPCRGVPTAPLVAPSAASVPASVAAPGPQHLAVPLAAGLVVASRCRERVRRREKIQWPNVLDPMKRQADLSEEIGEEEDFRQNFQGKRERTVRALMQSFLRMQDPLRIIRFGIEHPEGDGRGRD